MSLSIGVVLIDLDGKDKAPHLLVETSSEIFVGLRPLTERALEASQTELSKLPMGPVAIVQRSRPPEVRWAICEAGYAWREPASTDKDQLIECEPWKAAVVHQAQKLAIERWSTWRHHIRRETSRIRREIQGSDAEDIEA